MAFFIVLKFMMSLLMPTLPVLFCKRRKGQVFFRALRIREKKFLLGIPSRVFFFFEHLLELMTWSDFARKFFIRIVIMVILFNQVVDSILFFDGATTVANILFFSFAFYIVVFLFDYRLADRILSFIHEERKAYLAGFIIILTMLFLIKESLVVCETLTWLMMAAAIYPKKTGHIVPNGGTRMTLRRFMRQLKDYEKAA